MKLNIKNKQKLLDKWEEWKYDIFWSSRHIYDRNEFGDYHGKEFISSHRRGRRYMRILITDKNEDGNG